MNYRVEVLPKAAEVIRQLDPPIRQRLIARLGWLSTNLDSIHPQMLTGELRGMYKLRVGDYRLLYSVDRARKLLFVHRAGHRRDVYEE